jgi:hypothetical protein
MQCTFTEGTSSWRETDRNVGSRRREREKRVGLHVHFQFTFRVPLAYSMFPHMVHWTNHCQMWIFASSWERRTYANTDHLSSHRLPADVAAGNAITRKVAFAPRATQHCTAVRTYKSNLAVETVWQLDIWFLVQCAVLGALVKYTGRGKAALE